MNARRAVVLALALALAAVGCASSASPPASAAPACDAPTVQRDLAYVPGGDDLQQLDLYRPPGPCRPVPLVVWVHGGGWRTGDKSHAMDDKVALWNAAGWAAASINYRLTDAGVAAGQRVMAPMHNEDVAAAIGWLVAQADDLGVDPAHLALLGHSAGASIVAALTADPSYLATRGLGPTAVTCSAPLDTEGFDIATAISGGGTQAQLYRSVFGSDPARRDDLSPRSHLGEGPVPDLFLVARGEPDRRTAVADFARAARDAGGTVTVVDLSGFSHADVNRRIGDPTDVDLTPALETFLTACLDG